MLTRVALREAAAAHAADMGARGFMVRVPRSWTWRSGGWAMALHGDYFSGRMLLCGRVMCRYVTHRS